MSRRKSFQKITAGVAVLAAAALTFATTAAHAGAFTAGNLAVLQAAASAANTTCSIVELNTTTAGQTAVQTIAVDGTASPNELRFSGSATSTGYLADSDDGTLLAFTGANNTNASANVNTLNPRGVGTLNAAGTFSLPTTYTGVSGNQTRCATTVNNATWFIGDQGGLYSNGTTTASPTGNFRGVKSFGGTVYSMTASSTAALTQVGTFSAATGGTYTGLPGLTNNANAQDFYLISSGSNGSTHDVLYIISATSNTAGTVNKYSLVSGTWTTNGSYTTTFGGFGLCAARSGGGAVLYLATGQGALTANSVIRLTDTAGYNSAIAITTANNVTLYTTAAGTVLKGIAFAPASACTSPTSFNMTGGNGCTSSGVLIGLDNSQSGVNYQLFNGPSPVGSLMAGTDGSAISFGVQAAAGSYTVTGSNTVGNCTATMNGTVTITTTVTPSLTVAQSPAGSVCASSIVIFTATPVNGGAPTYVWKTNGVVVTGVTGNMFTNTAPVNNETIDCEMTSTAICASSATADAIPIVLSVTGSVTPLVSITVNPGSTNCAGTSVTFTATPVDGGTPTYQWNTNGVAVPGETNSTFATAGLLNGDIVTVVMASTDPCRSTDTATSNPITMAVNPVFTPSVTVGASSGSTICSNTSVNFTATPVNGGAAPTYQWKTNGTSVTGATSITFTTSGLKNNDVVTVVMTPSAEICVSSSTATSGGITMTVNPNFTPSVTVSANPSGPICSDTLVTFTAAPVNGGASPAYQWRTNGVPVPGATSATYASSILANGDVITCVLTPSPDICVSPATATSAALAISVNIFRLANVVFSENMGTPSITTVVNSYAGWQNNSPPIVFSSTTSPQSDVRVSNGSASAYTGASGAGNLFMGTATALARDFVISGINTLGLNSMQLQFGLRKETGTTSTGLITLEVSDDGVTWTPLTFTQPAEVNTWYLTTATGTIPATTNLSIRFSKDSTNGTQFRIDDLQLLSGVVNAAAITSSGPTNFCAGGSVMLTASAGGASYAWSTGGTTPSIIVNAAGTYTVTIFDANGCSSSASQAVTVIPLPTVSVNSTTNCAGDPSTLTATTSASNPVYLWSPGGATAVSITVSPALTTTYTVLVTDGTTGCTNSGSGIVAVNPPATVNAGPDQLIQAGGAATLTGSIGGSASSATWTTSGTGSFDNNILLTAVYTPSAADIAAGTVTLTLTTDDPSGPCPAASDTMILTINHPPTAANAIYDCSPGLSVEIQITGTGGLAADPDGDALTVTATAPTLGTNAVTTAGNVFIRYQNTNGAPGLDSFTYTVNDGRGGTATGTIAVNVVAPGGQLHNTLSAPEILGAGPDVRLTFLGVPADNYARDWTHNLSPVILWLPLVTNTAAANGLVVYTNTPSVITPDFYPVRQVP